MTPHTADGASAPTSNRGTGWARTAFYGRQTMNMTRSNDPVLAVADTLRNWFHQARPSPSHALSQVDEARARGQITRDEYLALLDAWPADDA